MNNFKSDISHKEFPIYEKVSGKWIRASILQYIQKQYPHFTANHFLSTSELDNFREAYISQSLAKEVGDLTELEKTVLASLQDQTILTDKLEDEEVKLSFGQRIADSVATFGGSWTFILSFGVFIFLWILINVWWITQKTFDPYPFILLNLILSCIAALQAPIIMMSQNRQEEKDRERARKDYMINLKSELEIRILHEKIDHLILHQQEQLLEIQKVQIEMLNDIVKRVSKEN